MTRAAVETVLYLMDEAFEPPDPRPSNQSFLPNLLTVPDDVWCVVPPGGSRSIKDIVMHVGGCKYVYDNHAFGDGSLTWTSKLVDPWAATEPHMTEVIDWLRAGQRRLRHHVEQLDDDGLLAPRRANWGTDHETRWLINVMIQHDLYHAGEINHIRSLLAGEDRWAHEMEAQPASA